MLLLLLLERKKGTKLNYCILEIIITMIITASLSELPNRYYIGNRVRAHVTLDDPSLASRTSVKRP